MSWSWEAAGDSSRASSSNRSMVLLFSRAVFRYVLDGGLTRVISSPLSSENVVLKTNLNFF